MPILSIVIPIYNVEKYIDRCFESIYNQSVDDNQIEVIAINDGTPDASMRIVAEYSNEHTNLKVINKENGGVSSARNLGIQKSVGKYVMFVDPDDYLSEGTLSNILHKLNRIEHDLVIYRAFINGVEFDPWIQYVRENDVMSGTELFKKGYKRGAVWGCVYNKKFLSQYNISFPLGVMNGEDTIFFCQCQLHAQSISFSNIPLYNVFIREGSATYSISEKKIRAFAKTVKNIDSLLKKYQDTEHRDLLSSYKYGIVSQWVHFSIMTPNVNLNYLKHEIGIKQYLPIQYFNPISIQQLVKLFILNYFFSVYYYLNRIKFVCRNRIN